MPLIDAAFAFALTMLAIASLSTTLVAFVNSKMKLRRRKLEEMVNEFFKKKALPAAEKGLSSLIRRKGAEKLEKIRSEIEAFRIAQESSQEQAQPSRFMHEARVQQLVGEIDAEELISLSAEGLKEWIRNSELGKQWQEEIGRESEELIERLGLEWERLGDRYTEWFRGNAKVMNTLVAGLLALVFNIDAIFMLDVYLSDGDVRQGVIAQRSGDAQEAPTVTAKSEISQGVVEQELMAFEQAGFPLGWEHFPNCPPTSADARCVEYWQNAVDDFDISQLSYSDRQQINPSRHLDVALFGRALSGETSEAQSRFGGGLTAFPLISWIVGLALTAFLAGQGAPFWFELVQELAAVRRRWRKNRADEEPSQLPSVLRQTTEGSIEIAAEPTTSGSSPDTEPAAGSPPPGDDPEAGDRR